MCSFLIRATTRLSSFVVSHLPHLSPPTSVWSLLRVPTTRTNSQKHPLTLFESKVKERQMARSVLFAAAAVASSLVAANAAHPTLPFNWRATVKEAEVGVVYESYRMVYKPTDANPSAKWTNFTDGSCQRLIRDGPLYAAKRYLLKCDALDCCIEDQSGNHVEYQIPNVHPAILAPVTFGGEETIHLGDGTTVDADVYTWSAGLAKYFVYTTGGDPSKNETADLHRWTVQIQGDNITNEYYNYTAVQSSQAWIDTFEVPDVCNGAMSCGDAHKLGLISDKSLAFVRAKNQ